MSMNALSGLGQPPALAPASVPAVPASASPPQPVAALLKLREMSHADLAKAVHRTAHMKAMSADMLRRPATGHADVAAHLSGAIARGVLTHAEAVHLHGRLPQDPQQIRPAIERLHHDATHANDALQAEQGARLWGAPPGSSRGGVSA